MKKYKPLSVRVDYAKERQYREQLIIWFAKVFAGIIIVGLAYLLITADDVHAFFPWNSSTAQERYNEAEENYSNAMKMLETAQKQLLERKGDLAFEKLGVAVEERNIGEIDRLNSVIAEIQVQLGQDFRSKE